MPVRLLQQTDVALASVDSGSAVLGVDVQGTERPHHHHLPPHGNQVGDGQSREQGSAAEKGRGQEPVKEGVRRLGS